MPSLATPASQNALMLLSKVPHELISLKTIKWSTEVVGWPAIKARFARGREGSVSMTTTHLEEVCASTAQHQQRSNAPCLSRELSIQPEDSQVHDTQHCIGASGSPEYQVQPESRFVK